MQKAVIFYRTQLAILSTVSIALLVSTWRKPTFTIALDCKAGLISYFLVYSTKTDNQKVGLEDFSAHGNRG